jgi:hypothetical protein
MICASLNSPFVIRIILGLVRPKNFTFEHHFFGGSTRNFRAFIEKSKECLERLEEAINGFKLRSETLNPNEAPNFRKFLEFSNLNALDKWLINRSSDSKIF